MSWRKINALPQEFSDAQSSVNDARGSPPGSVSSRVARPVVQIGTSRTGAGSEPMRTPGNFSARNWRIWTILFIGSLGLFRPSGGEPIYQTPRGLGQGFWQLACSR